MKKYIRIFVSVFIFSPVLFSQVQQEWLTRFALSASDVATSIVVDAAGNVYCGGYSFTTNQNYDYAVVKYNSAGVQQWYQKYNGTGNDVDFGRAIAVDLNGNVFITGSSRAGGVGTEDFVTIKYNSAGIQQWAARYNGPAFAADVGYAIVLDDLGNAYVTGFSMGAASDFDFLTIKYLPNGDTAWTARYNGPGNSLDQAYSIARDSQGNIYITGASRNTTESGSEDYCTVKYNSSGVQQWAARYDGPGHSFDTPDELCLDAAGNVYIVGNSVTSGIYNDYCTIKYNSAGVQQWVERYSGPVEGHEDANSITVDNSGNVYITGNSPGLPSGGDYCTIKYNSVGSQQWAARYNGPASAYDNAHVVKVDAYGYVYVTGGSNGVGSNFDYCLIKYYPNGDTVWVQRYNGPAGAYDVSYAMALDTAFNIYITGQSAGTGTGDDFATIKFSQLVGVRPVSNEIPKEFVLSQNYPNPFNPVTIINCELPVTSNVKLAIYDMLGREIKLLANEEFRAGKYLVEWNASNYPSGVYYYTLTAAGYFTQTKKMVLIK